MQFHLLLVMLGIIIMCHLNVPKFGEKAFYVECYSMVDILCTCVWALTLFRMILKSLVVRKVGVPTSLQDML